ncbi:DUF2254 domain-containing protein [Antarctobacter heliothermus]|nr:DUF2254 domain-containing protein [Antarctobacter heliothermus]
MANKRAFSFVQSMLTLRRISRILWVRVALLSALSVIAALSAELLGPLIPDGPRDRFTASATLPILNILANGMLAVATFSLGIMVSTHRTLAQQSTPRIHRLLMEDTSTQTMLATFIGAFVFALSSIILYRAGYYSESASVIVFAATVLVVAAIVVSLVRWIGQLSKIGSVEYALLRAEQTASEILRQQRHLPRLGGRPLDQAPPEEGTEIFAPTSGFLRRIDMDELQNCAESCDATVCLDILPGAIVLREQVLGTLRGSSETKRVAACFLIDPERTYEQDPGYALQALRESASKALSPGINDPKTAIDVIARLERLLWDWALADAEAVEPSFDRVYLREVGADALLEAAFRDLSRDAAGFGDVLDAVAMALAHLRSRMPATGVAVIDDLAADLRAHGDAGLMTDRERARLTCRLDALGLTPGH